jgi:hypothetical protein
MQQACVLYAFAWHHKHSPGRVCTYHSGVLGCQLITECSSGSQERRGRPGWPGNGGLAAAEQRQHGCWRSAGWRPGLQR